MFRARVHAFQENGMLAGDNTADFYTQSERVCTDARMTYVAIFEI